VAAQVGAVHHRDRYRYILSPKTLTRGRSVEEMIQTHA